VVLLVSFSACLIVRDGTGQTVGHFYLASRTSRVRRLNVHDELWNPVGDNMYLKVELAEDPSFATGARYLNKLIQGHRTQNGRRQASKQKAEVERGGGMAAKRSALQQIGSRHVSIPVNAAVR